MINRRKYVLYYYQDILGVSAFAMGIILLVARIFDAFNDTIMGVIVAKTKTKTMMDIPYWSMVPAFFIMSAVGILNVIVTIFLSNTVDYGEWKNRRRDEVVTNVVKASGNSVFGLRMTMTIIPMVILVMAVVVFKRRYILTDEKLIEIGKEIAK